jgi:hypothetical protein
VKPMTAAELRKWAARNKLELATGYDDRYDDALAWLEDRGNDGEYLICVRGRDRRDAIRLLSRKVHRIRNAK